jgi:beta-galactosidase
MSDWSRREVLKAGVSGPLLTALAARQAAADAEPGRSERTEGPVAAPGGAGRERLLLDFGWRFHFGHANDPAKDLGFGSGQSGNFQKTGTFLAAVSRPAFDDADWKAVTLPHDWAVELPFQDDASLSSKGFYPLGRTYPETSVGWYRLAFELPAADAGKRLSIEFDGVYREALVVLNGFYVGRHGGGYDPFGFDVTDFASPGATNVLLVRVDATLSDGWFYEGAGIYRHAWLVKANPVHVKKWGTFVRAQVRPGEATLQIRTEVENHGAGGQDVTVTSTVLDPSGKAVGNAVSAPVSVEEWGEGTCEQELIVKQPALWSLEERNQYRLVTELRSNGALTDRYETRFGIRDLRFDAGQGFFLNGRPVKVKGTCNHQDHAGLGAALPDAVQLYRVRKLLEMGCNALRTSHNPPTAELLDACDELGMLVLAETRMLSSSPEGLAQLENMVRRDRNHPSVFMWSLGNEESVSATGTGLLLLTALKRVAMRSDGSRPITVPPMPMSRIGSGGLVVSDVMGYNYADPQAEAYHAAHPAVPVIGTENVSAVGTRGIYATDPDKGYVGSYDPYTTTGRASAEGWWRFVSARPWVAGGFVWTGFDYRGEPSPFQWPNVSSQYGVLDTCGFPKDTFYYYQSWWTAKPVLHVFPHWNWHGLEGQAIAVWVHSNLQKVELFLNGESLGAREMARDSHLSWNVPYAPGVLEARGYEDGRQVLTARRETTRAPSRIALRADRDSISGDGEDVAMVAVAVQDAQGRVVPTADNPVSFRVTGPGKLIGVGNGDPTSHESDKGEGRKAFSGLCMAIVQSAPGAGTITLEATSPGLEPARVSIAAQPAPLRSRVAPWNREVPVGSGITGLWRPASSGTEDLASFFLGAEVLFTFRQAGGQLTGTVERLPGFVSLNPPAAIEDGTVDGGTIAFKAGATAYTGVLKGDAIELRRAMAPFGPGGSRAPAAPSGPRPAIGPPPDGSDPSFFLGGGRAEAPLVLKRASR